MVYEVTVDYVTSTTVLVEADSTLEAEEAVYGYVRTDEGLGEMLQAVSENPNRHWSAFMVADMCARPGVPPEDADIRKKED